MSVSTATTVNVPSCGEAAPSDYFALLKPKVMSLVVFTGFAGLWVAPDLAELHPFLAFIAMLCLAVNAGAAGAINMWYERDIDSLMARTKNRPLPRGKIAPEEALSFGIILSLVSVMLMGLALNWAAAALLCFANFFYVFIYTIWLKRSTPQNIVIGGAAGAFPPLIGWAAVQGAIALEPLILCAIIFFWTPPHFWALSLFANSDYKKAGLPMMSVVAGPRATKIRMLVYTLILFPVSVAPWFMGFTGPFYGILAAFLSGFFVYTAVKVLLDKTLKSAPRMFGYSVFYLFALFLGYMINAV